jgi:hypothetical protein
MKVQVLGQFVKAEENKRGKCRDGGAGLQRHHKHGLFGLRGSHRMAKNTRNGNCAAMSSSQRWAAAAPINFTGSAEDGDVSSTTASAASDIGTGTKAPGFLGGT